MSTKITYSDVPRSILILGVEFKVELVDQKLSEYGECLGYERIIRLNRNQTKASAPNTLFHEAVHAALHVSGHTSLIKHKHEEALVMLMEMAFGEAIDINLLAGGKAR